METEIFFRTMSLADFEALTSSGMIPATAETFISPSLECASVYEGVTVQIEVEVSAAASLLAMGVRNAGLSQAPFGSLPLVRAGWAAANAFSDWRAVLLILVWGRVRNSDKKLIEVAKKMDGSNVIISGVIINPSPLGIPSMGGVKKLALMLSQFESSTIKFAPFSMDVLSVSAFRRLSLRDKHRCS